LGVIRYTQVPNVITVGGANASPGAYVSQFKLTVSGSPLLAVQATAAASAVSGGVYLNRGSPCSANAGALTSTLGLKQAIGTQIAFDGVSPANFLDGTTGSVSICMVPNGISAVDRGGITFSLITVAAGSSSPNTTVVDPLLVKVDKNGTSVKVLNIPSPDNTVDAPYIRMYNMGTSTGKIFGTLYSQDNGTMLGTANTTVVEALAPNAVTILTAADLATKFGTPKWAGRAWLQLESEVKGLRVQALIRTNGPGGVLVNMGDRVMVDGEKLERIE